MHLSDRWWLSIPLLACVVVVAGAAVNPDPVPECVAARRWVKEHSGALPSRLSELSRFTRAYRKAIYSALPRETKLSLWHEQLRFYSHSPELTEEQRAFVAELDRELDAHFGAVYAATHKEYSVRARAELGDPLAREVLANLGVNTPQVVASVVESGETGVFADCGCSTESDWCNPSGPGCQEGFFNCQPTDSGCGTFWQYACNGGCP